MVSKSVSWLNRNVLAFSYPVLHLPPLQHHECECLASRRYVCIHSDSKRNRNHFGKGPGIVYTLDILPPPRVQPEPAPAPARSRPSLSRRRRMRTLSTASITAIPDKVTSAEYFHTSSTPTGRVSRFVSYPCKVACLSVLRLGFPRKHNRLVRRAERQGKRLL